ncbi:hypothetical protein BD412_000759 [Thermoanaerobacterium thermosaccharolyticum]|nr:hypothetical protein [Thermoanaerobacterium thermosaccharolyticum]
MFYNTLANITDEERVYAGEFLRLLKKENRIIIFFIFYK